MPSPSDIAPNTLVPFHGLEKSFIHEPSDWENVVFHPVVEHYSGVEHIGIFAALGNA